METTLFVVEVWFSAYNPECNHAEDFDVEVMVEQKNDINFVIGIIQKQNNKDDVKFFLEKSNEEKEWLLKNHGTWKKASLDRLRILDSQN